MCALFREVLYRNLLLFSLFLQVLKCLLTDWLLFPVVGMKGVIRVTLTFNASINLQLNGFLAGDSAVFSRLSFHRVVIACWCCPEACLKTALRGTPQRRP